MEAELKKFKSNLIILLVILNLVLISLCLSSQGKAITERATKAVKELGYSEISFEGFNYETCGYQIGLLFEGHNKKNELTAIVACYTATDINDPWKIRELEGDSHS